MSNGQSNGDKGKPLWADPPSHVKENQDGSVNVGKHAREQTIEQALNSDDPQIRIEAKLDLLLDELGIEE